MSTVKFAPDAADYFVEVLTFLCRDTVAVTIHPQHGDQFGAVLVSNDANTLVYESWDKETVLPGGEPMAIAVDQIDELRVLNGRSRRLYAQCPDASFREFGA